MALCHFQRKCCVNDIGQTDTLRAAHMTPSFSIIKASPYYINNNTKLVASYLHILLMVNAHDVEVNPGPFKPKFPCQVCSLAVKWGQKGVCVTVVNVGTIQIVWACPHTPMKTWTSLRLFGFVKPVVNLTTWPVTCSLPPLSIPQIVW